MSSSSANSKYANSPQYPNGHSECVAGQHRKRTCNYCDEEYGENEGYNDDYCSKRCRYNGIAYDVLRSIRHDHTHCVSCFRRLKTLIPPGRNSVDSPQQGTPHKTDRLSKQLPSYGPPDHPGAISVGGIVPTERAEPGYHWDVGEHFRANPTEDDWEFLPNGVESTKVCSCGVAHHATTDYLKEDLTAAEAVRRTERLTTVLDDRIAADDWDHAYDENTLFQMVKKFKNDSQERAAGKDFEIFEKSLGLAVQKAELN